MYDMILVFQIFTNRSHLRLDGEILVLLYIFTVKCLKLMGVMR